MRWTSAREITTSIPRASMRMPQNCLIRCRHLFSPAARLPHGHMVTLHEAQYAQEGWRHWPGGSNREQIRVSAGWSVNFWAYSRWWPARKTNPDRPIRSKTGDGVRLWLYWALRERVGGGAGDGGRIYGIKAAESKNPMSTFRLFPWRLPGEPDPPYCLNYLFIKVVLLINTDQG